MKQEVTFSGKPTMDALKLLYAGTSLLLSDIPEDRTCMANVVVEEAYANIVNYSGATGTRVSLFRNGETFRVCLTDDGVPFNPNKHKLPDPCLTAGRTEPGGFGIFLIRSEAKRVRYRRKDGKNILTLWLAV